MIFYFKKTYVYWRVNTDTERILLSSFTSTSIETNERTKKSVFSIDDFVFFFLPFQKKEVHFCLHPLWKFEDITDAKKFFWTKTTTKDSSNSFSTRDDEISSFHLVEGKKIFLYYFSPTCFQKKLRHVLHQQKNFFGLRRRNNLIPSLWETTKFIPSSVRTRNFFPSWVNIDVVQKFDMCCTTKKFFLNENGERTLFP